jgi:hypothetical protein
MSPGFDGNHIVAIATIFSSNGPNWSPDVDVRIGGIALGCGLELIYFHTMPGSCACREHSQHSRLVFCIALSYRFLACLN